MISYKVNQTWLYGTIFVIAACAVSYLFFDRPIAYYCKSLTETHKELIRIADVITKIGYSTWYLVASCLGFLLFRFVLKNDRYASIALFIFLSVAVSGLLTDILKVLFARYRPGMLFSDGLYGFALLKTGYKVASFPSGHATTVASLAAAAWLISRKAGYALIPIAALGALSRVIIGVHYPGDVLCGVYIGVSTACLLKRILESRGFMFSDRRAQAADLEPTG